MPTNGLLLLLLLLDRPIIKGMHICCFCILMQLLTHYDHVIVQSLIVHPVCNAERLESWRFLHRGSRGGFSQLNKDWTEIPERWRYRNAFVQINIHPLL